MGPGDHTRTAGVALSIFAAAAAPRFSPAARARSHRRRAPTPGATSARSPGATSTSSPRPARGRGGDRGDRRARVIARYASFTLVSADGSANELLRLAGADRRDDMRTVDGRRRRLRPGRQRALERARARIRSPWSSSSARSRTPGSRACGPPGATVVTYMAQNAYLVYASGAERSRARRPSAATTTRCAR